MNRKISKTDMIDAISLYFRKNGQRITYLEKTNKKNLEEIIQQYNITPTKKKNETKRSYDLYIL